MKSERTIYLHYFSSGLIWMLQRGFHFVGSVIFMSMWLLALFCKSYLWCPMNKCVRRNRNEDIHSLGSKKCRNLWKTRFYREAIPKPEALIMETTKIIKWEIMNSKQLKFHKRLEKAYNCKIKRGCYMKSYQGLRNAWKS